MYGTYSCKGVDLVDIFFSNPGRVNADSSTGEADWQWQELLAPGTPETEIRERQVNFRSRQVIFTHSILDTLSEDRYRFIVFFTSVLFIRYR